MRDPYLDHVLAIAGLDPALYGHGASSGAHAPELDPQVVAANLRAAELTRQYAPAPVPLQPQPGYLAPPGGYAIPYAPQPAQLSRPPVDWAAAVFSGLLGALIGYAIGRRP